MKEPDSILAAGLSGRKQHSGRSPIFDWMWERYDVYGEQLSQRGMNWEAMAKEFKTQGIMDGRGNPPTGKTVASTFYKVRQIRTGRKPKRRAGKRKPQIRRTFQRTAA